MSCIVAGSKKLSLGGRSFATARDLITRLRRPAGVSQTVGWRKLAPRTPPPRARRPSAAICGRKPRSEQTAARCTRRCGKRAAAAATRRRVAARTLVGPDSARGLRLGARAQVRANRRRRGKRRRVLRGGSSRSAGRERAAPRVGTGPPAATEARGTRCSASTGATGCLCSTAA
eukprot:COSAG04_NODE_609_length_12066_cov_55.131695_2_plen_174_part_00